MWNDLQYGFRQLVKNPGFTFVAMLTLALGIGANTAIFSVVNAVLLKPLPFPNPQELVAVGGAHARQPFSSPYDLNSLSYPDYFDFRDQQTTFAHLALYRDRVAALLHGNEAQSIRGEKVTAEFLDVLGIKPAMGHNFAREDEQAGGGPGGFKIILGHSLWQRVFNSDPNILGTAVTVDGRPFTVIGVMPKDFQFPIQTEGPEFYVTIAEDASDGTTPTTTQRGNHSMAAVGRLKPGVTAAQALADLKTIASRLEKQYPESNTYFTAALLPLREELVGDVRTALYVLFGAVVCLLLIANANVANLLLARASVRGREIALRAAVGASRFRIIRQLLTESTLLAGLGGLAGLLVAQWGTEALIKAVPRNIPRIGDIQLDAAVLGFTLLVSLFTGIIFGLVPAWQTSHVDLNTALKAGNRGAMGSEQNKHRLRNGLVVAEVSLALILLVCAGLLIQSFARLGRVKTGMQSEQVLTARIQTPDVAYPKPENIISFYDQFLARVRSLPGVKSASVILPLPLSGSNITTSFDMEERPLPEGQQNDAPTRVIYTDYFQTMGIPLLQGRAFNEADRIDANPVLMINEQFAKKYFPGENPVGKRIKPGWSVDEKEERMREIIGVVGNVKHIALNKDFTPEMYMPATQVPIGVFWVVIRAEMTNPAGLTSAVRSELANVDKNIPLTRVRVFGEYMSASISRPRFNALLLSIFAGTALILTAIGIYGVMAYSVAQRTSEIGIRMALGAAQSSIFRLVVGQAMTLVAMSIVLGLAGAFGATRLLGSMLFGVGAWDPTTFGAIVLLISVVAFLAAWLPARRATLVNPIEALRAE